jgi:hypothetical protein
VILSGFTAFLPFWRQKAAFLPSAGLFSPCQGPKNGRKAERQNDSASAETFLPRQRGFCGGRSVFLLPLICHESFVGLGFRV